MPIRFNTSENPLSTPEIAINLVLLFATTVLAFIALFLIILCLGWIGSLDRHPQPELPLHLPVIHLPPLAAPFQHPVSYPAFPRFLRQG